MPKLADVDVEDLEAIALMLETPTHFFSMRAQDYLEGLFAIADEDGDGVLQVPCVCCIR